MIQQVAGVETNEEIPAETAIPRPETPSTSHPQSEETESTNPTTPSSTQLQNVSAPGDATPVAPKSAQKPTQPAVLVVPAIPKSVPRDVAKTTPEKPTKDVQHTQTPVPDADQNGDVPAPVSEEASAEEAKSAPSPPKAWTTPKLWTGLFNPAAAASAASSESERAAVAPNFGKTNAESLAEALRSFNATSNDAKVIFLEPRGLVNTGNMCYMNSVSLARQSMCVMETNATKVLQVLVFCAPFYNFLDQVSKRAVHSFKSDTPLIEAM